VNLYEVQTAYEFLEENASLMDSTHTSCTHVPVALYLHLEEALNDQVSVNENKMEDLRKH
jgi:hypothetical protein